MTQGQIEKASGNLSEHPFIEIERQGFIKGANWYINSVWHNSSERPNDDKAILAISRDSKPFIGGPNNSKWADIVRDFRVTKWAYVEDLVPDWIKKED